MPTRPAPPQSAPVADVDPFILPRLETFNKIRPRKNRGKERKKKKFLRQTLGNVEIAPTFFRSAVQLADDALKNADQIRVSACAKNFAPPIERRSLRNDQTVDQPNRAVGVGGLRHIVRNHYNRQILLFVELAKEFQNADRRF